jgi:pantoate--beta-alanine ligase
MIMIETIRAMRTAVRNFRTVGQTVGFVPTMGSLHEGHLSLVRASKANMERTVVSVFVNPIQFGPNEDLDRYPRDLARDRALLDREGVDVLFHPAREEMIPEGFGTWVEVRGLQDRLCGRSRPGHFAGVCTIVLKLFDIVRPDAAFFGRKDAQQATIVRRMARDLNLDLEVKVLPTVRERDGLAMSSRNAYLTAEERAAAPVLYRSLERAREMVEAGERDAGRVADAAREAIGAEPLARVEYVEVVDPDELLPLERIEGEALIALAVHFGRTRLIDNVLTGPKES